MGDSRTPVSTTSIPRALWHATIAALAMAAFYTLLYSFLFLSGTVSTWRVAVLAIAALALLFLNHFHYRTQLELAATLRRQKQLLTENENVQNELLAIRAERRNLSQQVATLSARQQLYRAASAHHSFRDLMDEIAGVVHDIAGARDLTVFLRHPPASGFGALGAVAPHAYYRLASDAELSLSFAHTETLGRLWRDDAEGYRELVIPADLVLKHLASQTIDQRCQVTGEIEVDGVIIAGVRLAINDVVAGTRPTEEVLETWVRVHLRAVAISDRNVRESLERRRLDYNYREGLIDLACPLAVGDEQIGAIKVRFAPESGEEFGAAMLERSRLLSASAVHIAKALYSDRLYEMATKDALTGLYNKRHMLAQLESAIHVASRHGTKVALILADLDHFKRINDTYGHLSGDKLLREMGAIIHNCLRTYDIACRYGGEELAIIVPESDAPAAHGLAERLRATVEERVFQMADGAEVRMTISIGVAEVAAGMQRAEELIERADAALYTAKRGGRNQALVWREGMSAGSGMQTAVQYVENLASA